MEDLLALRVALISTPFLPVPPHRYGGTELVIAELIDGLVDLGHEPVLFSVGESSGGYRHRCEVRYLYRERRWPPNPRSELDHCAFAAEAIRGDPVGFHAIHAHCPSALALARFVGGPLVYTVHHPRDPELGRFYADHPEARYVFISRRQQEGFPEVARSAVIHHGLNPGRYEPSGRGGPHVAFLGRLSEVKGPATAIDVARAAGVEIVVAGRPHPEDQAFYRTQVEPRLRRPGARIAGEVDHGAKLALLSSASALLCPIEWDEPFGLVVVESMFCGCPPIGFRRGSLPELIEHGVTGFLAEDAAHMVELLKGPARPDRFDRRRCREQAVRRFGANRMVQSYLELYRSAPA